MRILVAKSICPSLYFFVIFSTINKYVLFIILNSLIYQIDGLKQIIKKYLNMAMHATKKISILEY
jgi:hypothetical protein